LTLRWIFWDNDGVLVDTEGLYRDAVRDAYRSFGAVHDFTGAAAVLSSITELPGTIDRYFSRSPQL
jgi:phosphoglycolate phosphatase-like HAD superfamily hydrolase